MSPTRMDSVTAAYVAWTEHRYYRYRGCAPDPDDPRLAAGSIDGEDGRPVRVPLDAWNGPDVDGGEAPKDREARLEAAKEVCLRCPVMVQCDAYANLTLSRADEVRGGRTRRERGKLVAAPKRKAPVAAPVAQLRTNQKLTVLTALAVHSDEYRVAIETGLDVRKANWQRARLVSGLGLKRSASRMELLAAAVKAGLVDGSLVVADDGSVPAIPPKTRKLLIESEDGQFLLWPSNPDQVKGVGGVQRSGRCSGRPRSLRSKFTSVAGQEALDAPVAVPSEWADVRALFAVPSKALEAVA